MSTIKPIETVYAGHRFRSRLEARWALWLDCLNIEWQYELEGFEVGAAGRKRRYLPDFYLPDRRLWVEVKGHEAALDFDLLVGAADPDCGLPLDLYGSADKDYLVRLRVLMLGVVPPYPRFHAALLIVGSTLAHQPVTPLCHRVGEEGLSGIHSHIFTPVMAPVAVEFNTDTGRPVQPPGLLEDFCFGFPCPQIESAYRAARWARFEHGEART